MNTSIYDQGFNIGHNTIKKIFTNSIFLKIIKRFSFAKIINGFFQYKYIFYFH